MFTVTAQKNMKRRLGESSDSSSTLPGMPSSKVRRIIMSSLPDRMMEHQTKTIQEVQPDTTVYSVIQDAIQTIHENNPQLLANSLQQPNQYPSYADLTGFFIPPTEAEIAAYQHDILDAVRSQDLDTLRKFHAEGRPMKCSNQFGESILHLACRKGLTKVAHFLIVEANVTIEVCDDYGRNCMHDAAWVQKPNFELIDLVLSKCPDLLYIKDRRGHTPLAFARKDQWKPWNDYFKTKTSDFLMPRRILNLHSSGSTSDAVMKTGTVTASPCPVVTPKRIVSSPPSVAKTGISFGGIAFAKVASKGIQISVPKAEVPTPKAVVMAALAAPLVAPPQATMTRAGIMGLLQAANAPSPAKAGMSSLSKPTHATIIG